MPWNDVLRARESRLFSSLNSHKMVSYALVSSVAVLVTVVHALRKQSNFYSLVIHLSKSNRSVLILANFGLLLALLCGQCAQRIFFGPLRPQEVERLYDRLWFFVTESLLAFTIFRDDFDIPFVLMFGFLLFVKSFHWLASDRIEWMDQRPYPGPPVLFHIRMLSLFILLWFVDLVVFAFAVDNTTKNGIGGMIIFANEYAILMASAMNITAKYLICIVDLRRAQRRGGEHAPPWQNKSMWVFYVELVTDFLKLATYLLFFLLIVTLYGLPLNIIRDVYLTGRSFITRLRALIRYRAATRNMDERYPDATEQEMSTTTDRTCIICREEMYYQGISVTGAQPEVPLPNDGPNMTPKKLPCGHIFHFYCLRSWLERQQSCPTCRQSVLDNLPEHQRRHPQAAPQPGLRQPAIQQQAGNDPLLRALGRFARNAAQPPPATAQQPQGPRNTGAQGWLPGPAPGVIIQYNIQYQGQPPQRQSPQTSTTPQPVPPFAGFIGPDQNWRPWNPDQRCFNREGAQVINEASTSASNNEVPVSQSSDPPSAGDTPQTPAGAAAQAALRRFGGQFASSPSSTFPSRPASSSTTASVGATTWSVPSLIPLDRHHTVPTGGALSTPSTSSDVPTSNPDRLVPMPNMPCSHNVSTGTTDAQLVLLDQITREAIDERIRILEGVSHTITACVEDLIRVRSALPLPETMPTALPQSPQGATTRDHHPR
ncbi:hypothetical protein PAXRUDRAFT_832347 [Paxillus rubicundulus Ve08.2h10]|uniref:RING-type E3 ubiquitin transferase n=1 Tax=Paxillus rubicundulus Ve08.2h10 TaxID=930991 RepID=A0A0D0CHM8_9AGAM|nr:hypothetical protein PAXRUDRAFT_832347 [Paxillus rubicundulus Ve08.2h10]